MKASTASGIIRKCRVSEFETILEIINDGAQAYKGVIPPDRWHTPYMTFDELRQEIASGVDFWGYERRGILIGVMGIQDKGDVTLVRHAYVRTSQHGQGIGTKLLKKLESMTTKPILIGTWTDAKWAIKFYLKNKYRLLSTFKKDELLKKYWNIPQRQIETSVVLADSRFKMDEAPPRDGSRQ
jgi:GNAT superfamily N-acetyltransferase